VKVGTVIQDARDKGEKVLGSRVVATHSVILIARPKNKRGTFNRKVVLR